MGYDTKFVGRFIISPTLTPEHKQTLEDFGEEEHAYEDGRRGGPGMPDGYYCQWRPTGSGDGLEWDGEEKFYHYVEWLQYLLDHFFKPWGYTVTGEVRWCGEEPDDAGTLILQENQLTVKNEPETWKSRIYGVIFDLDGTLADTLPLVIAAFRQAIEPLAKRSLTDAEIIATFGPSEEGTILALIPEHYDQGVADYLTQYKALHDGWPEPFPGIVDLLADLKARGVRLAMVTGKGEVSARMSLKRYGLESAFEYIETGDPHGPRKAECIQRILAHWQMDPSEAVYVGDAPTDVTAAREAGVGMIGAGWAPTTEIDLLAAQHPDVLLTTVSEFKNWLDARIA